MACSNPFHHFDGCTINPCRWYCCKFVKIGEYNASCRMYDNIREPSVPKEISQTPTINLRLRKFNINIITDDAIVYIIGRKKTGKTTLVKDILWYKQRFPIGNIITESESNKAIYDKIVPNSMIHNEFSISIENALKSKKETVKDKGRELDNRSFIIMDDCFVDTSWTRDKSIRSLFMNGGYYKILSIIADSSLTRIAPVFRGHIDYVFIFQETKVSARQCIYEQFAGIFPTFELFCQIMDQCTENYECLVIHNGAKTNKIEDCVFWYKAQSHSDFKIGSLEYWTRSIEYEKQKELSSETNTLMNEEVMTNGSIVQVRKY